MSQTFLALLAGLPIAAVFIHIVILRKPAAKAMPAAYALTCLLSILVWRSPLLQAAATMDGLLTAVSS